jgi:hypothetical protein
MYGKTFKHQQKLQTREIQLAEAEYEAKKEEKLARKAEAERKRRHKQGSTKVKRNKHVNI